MSSSLVCGRKIYALHHIFSIKKFFYHCQRNNVAVCSSFSPACHTKMTPGMYWPQHIARLRDTTLLYDQNGDDEEEEVDVKIVNQSWRLFSKRPYHN